VAHIEKVKNSSGEVKAYKVVVEIGRGQNRRRKTKTFTISENLTKTEAKKRAKVKKAEFITEREHGMTVDPEKITLSNYLDHWLKTKKIAATTKDGYKTIIDAHLKPALGDVLLQKLESFHLESYFIEKRENGNKITGGGLSENTLHKHYVLLNSALKKAVRSHLLKYNPLNSVESPQPEDYDAPVMSKKEYHKLLDAIKNNSFFFAFIMTALLTGMRRSEVLGLEWPEVNFEKEHIEVKKKFVNVEGGPIHAEKTKNSSSKRKIKMSKKLKKILKKHKLEQKKLRLKFEGIYDTEKKFVFCRLDGQQFNPKWYNDELNKYLEDAGLSEKYGIHTLRHTFATLNVKNKIPAEIVQKMLGHSSISTTMDIYYHHDTEEQKEATEKLDDAIQI